MCVLQKIIIIIILNSLADLFRRNRYASGFIPAGSKTPRRIEYAVTPALGGDDSANQSNADESNAYTVPTEHVSIIAMYHVQALSFPRESVALFVYTRRGRASDRLLQIAQTLTKITVTDVCDVLVFCESRKSTKCRV